MPDNYIIDVQDLCKSFADKTVVDHVSLRVRQGEVFGFLGPNGSGKTTTIRMLCGLMTPDAGIGTCLGYDIVRESNRIRQCVGYMTQKFSLYTDLSVQENLDFVARAYGITDKENKIQETMKTMELTPRRHQLTGCLSGGWKQRVALAACLLHDPLLLLLDEPTAGIDPIARRDFWDTIHGLSEQGVTTLMATHYMDEAERCTRLAYLAYSRLIITGTVSDVIAATHLCTWEIKGEITTHLLQRIKQIPEITQAALFGRHIHVCGFDTAAVEVGLCRVANEFQIQWQLIEPTLEDAFISLVKSTTGSF